MVVVDFCLVGSFGVEGWVFGVDDDCFGDGVGVLGGGLWVVEYFDVVDVLD